MTQNLGRHVKPAKIDTPRATTASKRDLTASAPSLSLRRLLSHHVCLPTLFLGADVNSATPVLVWPLNFYPALMQSQSFRTATRCTCVASRSESSLRDRRRSTSLVLCALHFWDLGRFSLRYGLWSTAAISVSILRQLTSPIDLQFSTFRIRTSLRTLIQNQNQ